MCVQPRQPNPLRVSAEGCPYLTDTTDAHADSYEDQDLPPKACVLQGMSTGVAEASAFPLLWVHAHTLWMFSFCCHQN